MSSLFYSSKPSSSSEDELMTSGKSVCKRKRYATRWSSTSSKDEDIFNVKAIGSSPIKQARSHKFLLGGSFEENVYLFYFNQPVRDQLKSLYGVCIAYIHEGLQTYKINI